MTTPTELDLDGIMARCWAVRADFSDREFARAHDFYAAMRSHDERLLAAREKASAQVREWTGCRPRDVGSFGLRLNLEASDLDLGIGVPVGQRDELRRALEGRADFKAERATSSTTTRLVYVFTVEDIEVDLSALTVEDFAVSCRMLDQIDQEMTLEERICHAWVKHLLRTAGRMEDYAAWKLVTYARYCPEFNWVPIPETV